MAASRELIKEHYNQHVEEGVTTKEVSSSTGLLAKSAKRDMAAHMTQLLPSGACTETRGPSGAVETVPQ
jgi:hypothetical protein